MPWTYTYYLIKRNIVWHLIACIGFEVILVFFDILNRFRVDRLNTDSYGQEIIESFFNTPEAFLIFYPLVVILSCSMTIFPLARRMELIALQLARVSPVNFIFAIGLFMTVFNAGIIVGVSELREIKKQNDLERSPKYLDNSKVTEKDTWISSITKDKAIIINAEIQSPATNDLLNVVIITAEGDFSNANIKHASKLHFDGNSWQASGLDFDGNPQTIDIAGTFYDLIYGYLKPKYLSIFSLLKVAKNLDLAGLSYLEYYAEFLKLIGLMIYPMIILLWVQSISMTLITKKNPDLIFKILVRIFAMLVLIYVVFRPLTAYAVSGIIPIESVIYLPHIILGGIGIIFFRRSYFL